MKRLLIPALCVLAAACTSRGHLYDSATPLAVRMVESEIARNPSPMTLDGIPAGKIKWNYTTGLELLAMMARRTTVPISSTMRCAITTPSCSPTGAC